MTWSVTLYGIAMFAAAYGLGVLAGWHGHRSRMEAMGRRNFEQRLAELELARHFEGAEQ